METPDAAYVAERTAQIAAHRFCMGAEHDPANGKCHGNCVVCGDPWPCRYAGPVPPFPVQPERDKPWDGLAG